MKLAPEIILQHGLLLGLVACCGQSAQAEDHVKTMKTRIVRDLLPADPKGPEAKKLIARGRTYAAELGADGNWKDIKYRDQTYSSWAPARHISRLQWMAKAYCLTGRDADLKAKVLKALDYWLVKKPKCRNYWWNAIGVPRQLYPTLFLMEKEISESRMKACLSILGLGYHHGKWDYHGDATGQNLVWIAGIQVYREVLRGKPDQIAHHLKRIAGEIVIAKGGKEGIKADNSFWQHGAILYSGGYGRGFSTDSARFAYLGHGTPLGFSQATMDLLSAYILDGQVWMCRGDTFDWSARGREIARKSTHAARPVGQACRYMSEIPGPRRQEFARAAQALSRNKTGWEGEPSGNRHFWRSDFMVHRRPGYYVSVKMVSNRTVGTESGNGENLRGYHLAHGCTYILRRGDEYDGIFPVWNWRRIPGVTCAQGGALPEVNWGRGARGTTAFVGGVSDGTYGVAAFDFKMRGVRARKAWFCFEHEIVCLGAGIACEGTHPVVTSVNQCLLTGRVTTSGGPAATNRATALTGPAWVHHDGVGYVVPEGQKVHLRPGRQKGSWHNINRVYPRVEETRDVFSLWIDHGAKPRNAAYAYHIVPGSVAGKMNAYAKNSGVDVLENTPALQAVRNRRLNILGIAFYKPGRLALAGGSGVEVDQACIVLVRGLGGSKKQVAVAKPASPAKRAQSVTVTVGKSKLVCVLPTGEQTGRTEIKQMD
jgi:chondroitin AC lyase